MKQIQWRWQYLSAVRYRRNYAEVKVFTEVNRKFPGRNAQYEYYLWLYQRKLPRRLREHRKYFSSNGRGYGENAFTAMWWELLREFRPRQLLEVGVFRGQTLSLWQMVADELNYSAEVWGISPLSEVGDEVSLYPDLDYQLDIQMHFRHFGLQQPKLLRSLSQSSSAVELIRGSSWDLIYLDGSHDLDVVRADAEVAIQGLPDKGILVMDDASLYTDYVPFRFSFAGHPGPSMVADQVAKDLVEIGACGHLRVFQKQ